MSAPFSAQTPHSLAGERLDRVIAMLCELSRHDAATLIEAGEVRVDGTVQPRRSFRLDEGQVVELDLPAAGPDAEVVADATVDVAVVHDDDEVIVVDKPAGLVVHPGAGHPTGTLVHGLLARFPELAVVGDPDRPGIVHRLDRDTSGLLVVARTPEAHATLISALQRRAVTRGYHTLVWGHLDQQHGLVDAPIARSPREPTKMAVVRGGREARTEYDVRTRHDRPVPVTELTCRLETGRTHQIRVHLQAIGHPVVGDPRYGGARASLPAPRQFLHAEHLAFVHPGTGATLAFDSPLPADLADVLRRLD
ncbi:MAG: RluA family pseudouridine synthase [Acidimicrobiales bacterium]|nr:RluA family pseudouridine synthase [Acidimicrobiales bacterium]